MVLAAPSWLVYGSLLVTGLLFLSERWRWFPFNAHKGWTVLAAVAGVGMVLAMMGLWFVVALLLRWRFQFGLRTLLVLTVAVALPFSWLAVQIKDAREQSFAIAAITNVTRPVLASSAYETPHSLRPPPSHGRRSRSVRFGCGACWATIFSTTCPKSSLEWTRRYRT